MSWNLTFFFVLDFKLSLHVEALSHPDLNSESVYKTQRDPAGGEKLFFSYDVDCRAS